MFAVTRFSMKGILLAEVAMTYGALQIVPSSSPAKDSWHQVGIIR